MLPFIGVDDVVVDGLILSSVVYVFGVSVGVSSSCKRVNILNKTLINKSIKIVIKITNLNFAVSFVYEEASVINIILIVCNWVFLSNRY